MPADYLVDKTGPSIYDGTGGVFAGIYLSAGHGGPMFKPKSTDMNALYLSLAIFLVLISSELYLDYKNDGIINGSLSEGDGMFWIFFVLGPVFCLGLPWSAVGLFILILLGFGLYVVQTISGWEAPDTTVVVTGAVLFHVSIAASLYINALKVVRKYPAH